MLGGSTAEVAAALAACFTSGGNSYISRPPGHSSTGTGASNNGFQKRLNAVSMSSGSRVVTNVARAAIDTAANPATPHHRLRLSVSRFETSATSGIASVTGTAGP